MSVKLKILFASLCSFAVTMALGLYAMSMGGQLGHVATRVFDESAVSINHVRAAQAQLIALGGTVTASRARQQADEDKVPAAPVSERQRLLAVARGAADSPPPARPAADAAPPDIAAATAAVLD
ncbi:MAG: hypothetical protein K2X49_21895, partial [Acetobacteraceae bacterium]|nr:hypothetical protein [Acetobacteraceae bacterium]